MNAPGEGRQGTARQDGAGGTGTGIGGTGTGTGMGAAVAAIAARGERTLVLHGEGTAARTATAMLPTLPEVCFVEVGAETAASGHVHEALRHAAEQGLGRLVLLGTADTLAALAPAGGLGGITADMGGSTDLAAEVAAAGSAGRAYALWEKAGLLGPCGRELCRRVADGLERAASAPTDTAGAAEAAEAVGDGAVVSTAKDTAASPIAAQVVLLDPGGERMVGMYGRLGR